MKVRMAREEEGGEVGEAREKAGLVGDGAMERCEREKERARCSNGAERVSAARKLKAVLIEAWLCVAGKISSCTSKRITARNGTIILGGVDRGGLYLYYSSSHYHSISRSCLG